MRIDFRGDGALRPVTIRRLSIRRVRGAAVAVFRFACFRFEFHAKRDEKVGFISLLKKGNISIIFINVIFIFWHLIIPKIEIYNNFSLCKFLARNSVIKIN